jgi:hypothetical protein
LATQFGKLAARKMRAARPGSRTAVSVQPEIAYSVTSVSARSTTAFVAARSPRW